MKSILDPKFRYTSSVDTNIAKTFARVKREQKAAAAQREAAKVAEATETARNMANVYANFDEQMRKKKGVKP